MSYNPLSNYDLEVALGNITGVTAVNKFGRCPDNVDVGSDSDIWDGANGGTGIKTWIAPTQARIHAIVSTDVADDSAGAGAKTIQVYGLKTWDLAETSEVITMDGTTPVNTLNSYVIIHRMKVLTKGASDVNVGIITATAATDSTITAQINASEGQTQMAIYGVPSIQTFVLNSYYASVERAAAGSVDIELKVNPEPQTELLNFQVKSTLAVNSTGGTYIEKVFKPMNKFSGPFIMKIVGNGSVNNMDVSAGFDGYLVDN